MLKRRELVVYLNHIYITKKKPPNHPHNTQKNIPNICSCFYARLPQCRLS